MSLKKLLLIIISVLISSLCLSQKNDTTNHQNLFWGISGGINISKFRKDTINYNYGTKPAIGLYGNYRLLRMVNIESTILYSMKNSSTATSYPKVENDYIDFNFTPQCRLLGDLYLQAGICYSKLLTSRKIILDGSNSNGVQRINNTGFNSEWNVIAGLECNLLKNLNIEINYNIPTSKTNTKNLQLTLDFIVNNKEHNKDSYNRIKRRKSEEQIRQLKNGVLLVRLRTYENTIKALEKIGNNKKAYNLKVFQDKENKKIISAFKKSFNFCNVAFFYDTLYKNVRNRNFDSMFLNDSLQINDSIKIDSNKPIFTAEFWTLEQDTTKWFSHYSYERESDLNLKKVENYYTSSTDFDLFGLIIMDKNSIQLNKPFPYFTRFIWKTIEKQPEELLGTPEFYIPFMTWSYSQTVEKMNKKLSRYYSRHK